MKTSFTRTGKFKLVLFLTLCAVLIGCAVLLCFNASSQNINSAGAPEPTEQTEISAPEREAKATATSVTIPSINASDDYTVSGNTATATYTGSAIQMTVGTNYNPNYMTSSEGSYTPYIKGTNAGSYSLTMTLKSGYVWSDGTSTAKTYTLVIKKAKLAIPKITTLTTTGDGSINGYNATAEYTGSEITMALGGSGGGYNTSLMTSTGGNDGSSSSAPVIHLTEIGSKSISVSLTTNNYTWADGTTTAKIYTLTITKAKLKIPSINASDSYTVNGLAATTVCTGSSIRMVVGTNYNPSLMNCSAGTYTPYVDGTNAGTYSLTMSLKDKTHYQWSDGSTTDKVYSLVITGKAISSCTFDTIATQTYNGSAKTPTFTVKDGSKILTSGTDYTLSYKNNVNVGTATVTISGKGNYGGTQDLTFTISPRNISNASFGTIGTQTYNFGSEIKPTPTITDKNINKTLTNNTDFTFSYSNNTAVGTATITITGKGNYTDTKSTTFSINARTISGATIGKISEQIYDGKEKKPTATVTYGDTTLSSTTDFAFSWSNNVNAGTATLTITGKGNFTDTKTAEFTISARDISLATAASIASQSYTGSEKKPLPTLTDLSKNLANGTDYTLSYANNVNVGTATITVTGKGNYSGTKTLTFAISQRSISNATVDAIDKYYYDGAEKTPKPTVKDGSVTLVEGTDFEFSYRNNVSVGTATLILTGKGNYDGTKEVGFLIEPPTIENATVTLSQTSFTYDGNAKTPSVTLAQIDDLTLTAGIDFTVSYSANVNAGTAKVILTGTGTYSGTKEVTFTINPADMSGATVSGLQIQYTYTGVALEPFVTVTLDGVTLVKNTDYLIEYSNNLNVGNAVITITGSRNYTGTLTDGFTIVRADLSTATVTNVNASYEYTGGEIVPNPTVNLDGLVLVRDADFTVTYSENTQLGTATITVTGMGNFTGTVTKTFEIVPADISAATVGGINASYEYTGGAIVLNNVSVTFNELILALGTDFTVEYANNVNVGTATVTITGTGNYTGTILKNFEIVEADMSGVAVSGIDETYEYTGGAIAPEPEVRFNGVLLEKGVDYTVEYSPNVELGTVVITVTGLGNFDSVTEVDFEIVAANLANAQISGIEEEYEYTGSAIRPEPTVTLNGVILEKDGNYTVSYLNNTNLGVAVVTVYGTGNYTGNASAAFTIVISDLSDAEVTGIDEEYEWTGAAIEPEAVVTLNGVVLEAGVDYDIVFADNEELGSATFTITGKGNYSGSIAGGFAVIKATPQVEVNYTEYNGTDSLFVGKNLPEIDKTAIYNGVAVAGTVAWNKDSDGSDVTLKDGTHGYVWTFTPDDTEHFKVITGVKELTAGIPNYISINAEWKDGVQPELFTSSSVSVILRNLKVTGIFNSGDIDEIVGGYSFVGSWDESGMPSTIKMPTVGRNDYYVTVKFGNFTDVIYQVEIKDVELTDLTVDEENAVKDYTALDKFNASSITVTATYNDGTVKTLDFGNGGYSVAYEKGTESLQYGDTKVTVTFTDTGVTKFAEIEGLTVVKKRFDGTLAFAPEDKNYNFGNPVTGGIAVENLPDWLTVTYEYEDEAGNIILENEVTDVGKYFVTAKFTVDDNYEPIADLRVEFEIKPIDPKLNPAVGGSLAVGTLLSDLTFTVGDGATAGTLVWDEASYELKAGINRCYYTFTPDDTKNYNVLHGYVDIAAETVRPAENGGGSLVGWQIALIIVCIVVGIIAIVALILALKLRRAPVDGDGFYDDVTEEDLKL